MNPSNPNHHRQTTSLVTGAGPWRHGVEPQNMLERHDIRSHYPAAYRVADIGADNQTRTAADPRTQDLPNPSSTPAATVRTNLSQALFSFGTPRRRENGCRVARRRRSDYGPVSP